MGAVGLRRTLSGLRLGHDGDGDFSRRMPWIQVSEQRMALLSYGDTKSSAWPEEVNVKLSRLEKAFKVLGSKLFS